MDASAGAPPSDRSGPWATFALTAAAVFLVSLDATVVVAAFPALRAAFGSTSPALLSLTLNAYTIVVAALLVPAGRMADLWGRKRLCLAGVALFTPASSFCAAAQTPESLIAARVRARGCHRRGDGAPGTAGGADGRRRDPGDDPADAQRVLGTDGDGNHG